MIVLAGVLDAELLWGLPGRTGPQVCFPLSSGYKNIKCCNVDAQIRRYMVVIYGQRLVMSSRYPTFNMVGVVRTSIYSG